MLGFSPCGHPTGLASDNQCILSILCLSKVHIYNLSGERVCLESIAYSLRQDKRIRAVVSHVLAPLCSLRMTAKDMACRTQ